MRAEALAWRGSQDSLQCDSVVPWEHGTAYLTPSAPDYWDANFVRVEHGALDGPALEAASDALLAGCRHRKLEVVDAALGERVRGHFAAAGWLNERLAMMRRAGPPPPVRHDVREVPVAETRALRAEWYTQYEGDLASQMEFAARQEPVLARLGMRAFTGGALGFVTLTGGPGAVEIEQLYVTPEARGRGLGASLLGAALAAGGQDVAWVVADDEGGARSLYERLGFATVWTPYTFVRIPGVRQRAPS